MEKITTLSVNVPYKSTGNVIRQKEVLFEVFQNDGQYGLRPVLSEAERRVANLPESLQFSFVEGKPVSSRGNKDGNFHVIQDAVSLLRIQNLIP
jgi:hypothetical protein